MLMTSSRNKFVLLQQNPVTDVSVGFRAPCCSSFRRAPAWRLHTNHYKFGLNISSDISYMKCSSDLNLGEGLCMFTSFHFPDSGLYLLNGFDFFKSILNGVTLKTSNYVILKHLHSLAEQLSFLNPCIFPTFPFSVLTIRVAP